VISFVVGVVAAGLLALATSVVLFVLCRFERFVGVRYLERSRGSVAARWGLVVAAGVTAVAAALFFASRGHSRGLETAGVVMILLGTLAVISFLLMRIFSVFTTVSTLGVVLGVMSLVVVLAVTSGFEREFQDKVLAVNAHLIITPYGIEHDLAESEREADAMMVKLRSLPGLDRMAKFSFSAAEVMIGRVGANLKGVDMQAGGAPELKRAQVAGSVEDLGKPASCPSNPTAGRIVLGAELARKTRASVGECVQVLVPFSRNGEVNDAPEPFAFKVVAIFQMGFQEYDARLAFINIEDARRLANARESVFGVELRFRDPLMAIPMLEEVEKRLGPEPRVIDWKTLNHNLFMALTMQKLIIAMVLGFIIVVAAFNIISSLMLIILAKVREIAILSSMGARSSSVLRIFLVAGSFVGFAGTTLGILFGLIVCGLALLYGYPLDPKVYLITKLPVEVSGVELLFVAGATQLICFLATLYPAVRAARLKVVDGLRYI
jgi:lipoprotein-releasing system permease protein